MKLPGNAELRMKIRDKIPIILLFVLIWYLDRVNERQQNLLEDQLRELTLRRTWSVELVNVLRNPKFESWRHNDALKSWDEFFAANPTLIKPDNFLPYVVTVESLYLPDLPLVKVQNAKPKKTN